MIKEAILGAMLLGAVLPAWAARDCEELKAEIAARLKAKGVQKFALDIVPLGTVKAEDKVVGRCGGNTKQIVYWRG